MTRLFFALLLVTVTIAQATILPPLNVLDVGPNFVLVLLLVWSAHKGVGEGVLWAFGLGLLLDILTMEPFGVNGLALIPVAVIGGVSNRPLFHSGIIIPMLLVVLATFVYQLVGGLAAAALGHGYALSMTVRLGLLTAFLNMMVVPLAYLVVLVMDRMGVRRAARA